ncbi:hypothetical protein [Microbispora amethystogenes]|uniref:Uncharacterized protein n=1 Tax=Microbispora amethystogenes TaxID=1427754 RepID=A0ABQ4FLY0_9ACTN|nr:hypothetical protein [Microbispora amethystogenes]GIH35792.1 hypothetical protein Mam01_59560 [Microbispora amethystogenes]
MSQSPFGPPDHPNQDVRFPSPYAQPDDRPGHLNASRPLDPGYPSPSEPPAARGTVSKLVLVVLAGVVAAAVAVVFYSLRDGAEKTDESQSPFRTHVVEPETLGGRAKHVTAGLRRVIDRRLATVKKAVPQATGTVVAFYGNPGDKNMVMAFAVSAPVPNPNTTIDRFVAFMGVKAGHMKQVQPGPLGGVAKCGDATFVENVVSSICFWADSNTRGMIAMYFESGDQAAAHFVTMRDEIEQRD